MKLPAALRSRRAAGVLILALGAVAASGFLRNGVKSEAADWTVVRRDDLVLGVEVTGTLKAVDSSLLGPPQIQQIWNYKIARLATEGSEVKKGEAVLAFDGSELERELEQRIAEAASATKQREKKQVDIELRRREDALRLAEAEGRERKAALKVDRPEDLASALELRQAKLDLELSRREIAYLRERTAAAERSAAAQMRSLSSRRDRAEQRVREIRDAIEKMTVPAPRDGTVIYVSDWREEKKKVGDNCWRGEKVLEIPDLREMIASGEVDEADAGKLAEGQRVTLRLDAHPDVEFSGRVASIWKTVQQKSFQHPLRVVRLDISLDRTDTRRMRPGMRFRGKIETGRVERAIILPLDAVFEAAEGPVAFRKTVFGFETAALGLGRRNDTSVEVIEGVREGDEVARRDLRRRS